jgi:hypothetical protein
VEAGMLNWYIPLISSFLTGTQKLKKKRTSFFASFLQKSATCVADDMSVACDIAMRFEQLETQVGS